LDITLREIFPILSTTPARNERGGCCFASFGGGAEGLFYAFGLGNKSWKRAPGCPQPLCGWYCPTDDVPRKRAGANTRYGGRTEGC